MIAWVTHSRQTVDLGAIPTDTYVMRAHCHVTEAFNSNGTDTVTVGTDADPDAFVTSIDVSTTGIKSCTLGARAGYGSSSPLKIFYANGGSEATTGAALIILETIKAPPSPI